MVSMVAAVLNLGVYNCPSQKVEEKQDLDSMMWQTGSILEGDHLQYYGALDGYILCLLVALSTGVYQSALGGTPREQTRAQV